MTSSRLLSYPRCGGSLGAECALAPAAHDARQAFSDCTVFSSSDHDALVLVVPIDDQQASKAEADGVGSPALFGVMLISGGLP